MKNKTNNDNPAVEKAEKIANGQNFETEVFTEFEKVDGVTVENQTTVKVDGEKLKRKKREKERRQKSKEMQDKKERISAEKQAKIKLKAEKHAEKVKLKRAKAERLAEIKKAKAEEKAYLKRVKAEQKHEHRQNKAERRERRRDNKRNRGIGGWLAAVISLGCVTLVLGSLLAMSVFTDYMQFGKVNTNSATSQRSFYDFVGYVDNIETNMSKLFVSSDKEGQQKILGEIAVQSSLADSALSELPIMDESKYKTSKYINQVYDYAKYLNNRLIYGDSLTNEEISTLRELYKINLNLKNILSELSAKINQNYDFSALSKNDANDIIVSQFKDIEQSAMNYPEMIYDGPFSDGIQGKKPKAIEGEEITELKAIEIFNDIFGRYDVEDVEVEGMIENGEITCYNINSKTDLNGEVYAQISKVGGKLIMFNAYRDCNEQNYTEEQGVQIATEFLSSLGLTEMSCVWTYTSGSTQFLNFAYQKDGVSYYPDLVKVKVCMQRGVVSGIDADGYYMNHTQRDLSEPKYTLTQAEEKVSEEIEVRAKSLAVIPTGGGNEKLAYEFIGEGGGETYYIYIDANTLKEADIFKVVNTEQGRLLI